MKFSSALTLTTVVSIMSTVQGAPVPGADPIHYRRHSSVSELSGRQLSGGADYMSSFGAAFEPGNGIGKLLNFVKRQLGSTDPTPSTGAASSSAGNLGSGTSSSTSSTGASAGYSEPHTVPTDNLSNGPSGLMGGGLSSPQDAGFAYEPGQGIRAA